VQLHSPNTPIILGQLPASPGSLPSMERMLACRLMFLGTSISFCRIDWAVSQCIWFATDRSCLYSVYWCPRRCPKLPICILLYNYLNSTYSKSRNSTAFRPFQAHLVWDQGVADSNPVVPTFRERKKQSEERCVFRSFFIG
jgi:hypothetical protein